jgi:hypothetical protein
MLVLVMFVNYLEMNASLHTLKLFGGVGVKGSEVRLLFSRGFDTTSIE